jgi:uncharacterized membrane protein YfcA
MIAGFDVSTLLWLAGALALGGAVTGVLAGLFGVGGGAITVPILFEVFGVIGAPEAVAMPLAVGTSLAVIIPTSLRSARGHHAKGVVDTALLRAWAAPLVVGVCLGAFIARYAPPLVFQAVFIGVAGMNATKMLLGRASWRVADDLPKGFGLRVYGFVIGLLSALMGIGGGALSTLAMTLHGRPIHQSVATSAGVGVFISIPGALGYMAAGWGRVDLPPFSIGFVSALAFALIVPTTLMTTQIGVNLAHALPRRKLELLFGLFLLAVCLRFVHAIAA